MIITTLLTVVQLNVPETYISISLYIKFIKICHRETNQPAAQTRSMNQRPNPVNPHIILGLSVLCLLDSFKMPKYLIFFPPYYFSGVVKLEFLLQPYWLTKQALCRNIYSRFLLKKLNKVSIWHIDNANDYKSLMVSLSRWINVLLFYQALSSLSGWPNWVIKTCEAGTVEMVPSV